MMIRIYIFFVSIFHLSFSFLFLTLFLKMYIITRIYIFSVSIFHLSLFIIRYPIFGDKYKNKNIYIFPQGFIRDLHQNAYLGGYSIILWRDFARLIPPPFPARPSKIINENKGTFLERENSRMEVCRVELEGGRKSGRGRGVKEKRREGWTCVCVCEKERKREKEREIEGQKNGTERERQRERKTKQNKEV